MIRVSRRRFIALAGGAVAAGCSGSDGEATSPSSTGEPPSTSTTAPTASSPPSTTIGSVTTISTPAELVTDGRVLVLVQLDGGNDAINTLPPDLGSYRDQRPTLALPESVIIRTPGLPGHGLHPSLRPVLPLFESGRVATVAGIGFTRPDRSHFTSIDRWDRADMMQQPLGWLGRWLDTFEADLPALGATSLGSAGSVLRGARRRGTSIENVDAFAFPDGLSNADIRALSSGSSGDPLADAARQAFAASVGAVEEFDAIADAVRAAAPESNAAYGASTAPFTDGLTVAAEMIRTDPGVRVITVTAGGFDTHSEQMTTHVELLDDLAGGLASFWATLDGSGDGERVLVMTTSEFGRRVAENGSNGSDHGAGGVSFVMGDAVESGLFGSIDTDAPVEGDLSPIIDPAILFTTALDWLGADVERILGRRDDSIRLLS